MVANVEAGHVWNGHETTTGVSSYVSNSPLNDVTPQYDYHATAVGFMINGLGPLSDKRLLLLSVRHGPRLLPHLRRHRHRMGRHHRRI